MFFTETASTSGLRQTYLKMILKRISQSLKLRGIHCLCWFAAHALQLILSSSFSPAHCSRLKLFCHQLGHLALSFWVPPWLDTVSTPLWSIILGAPLWSVNDLVLLQTSGPPAALWFLTSPPLHCSPPFPQLHLGLYSFCCHPSLLGPGFTSVH